MDKFTPTPGTTLKRLPERGEFDRQAVYRILDEAFVCHVGFAVDGRPFVIPTSYGRSGDKLYIHGSSAGRTMRSLSGEIPVCVTVTLIDGLVLARSAFHHSVNYRSVVMLGQAVPVTEPEEKFDALRVITEHVVPGRWPDVREPDSQELKATSVLMLPLVEVSAKVRTGPPKDDEEDMVIPAWAGVLPLRMEIGVPIKDDFTPAETAPPNYVLNYKRD